MKKRTFQNFLGSFRGFSLSVLGIGGGVSFIPPTNERDIVLKLIFQLGDRRVLFHSGCGVPRKDMIASAETMRSNITAALEAIPESRAASFLAQMRHACHDFQTFLEENFRSGGYGGPKEDFYMAIGQLHPRRRKAIRQRRRKAANVCRFQTVMHDSGWNSNRSLTMTSSQHVYEIRTRKDRRGFDLIGDRLPLGLLWFEGPDAIVDAVNYAKSCSGSHPAIIRVFDEFGAVVGTIESVGNFRERNL